MNKNNTLYLECYSGISGDMTVAALLDLGADQKVLETALKSLDVDGFETKITRVSKGGLDMCDFDVLLEKGYENHDHDMEYLHGHHNHEHTHDHKHPHEHHHDHSHDHALCEHHHTHVHRGLLEILKIINGSDITDRAKEIAERIFTIIAQAESKAHGVPMNEVHFHEVGAVDSIVDIVAIAVCVDNLGITQVIVPELYEGRGWIRCQHGLIPVPVPAVTHIAQAEGLTLHMTETEGELVSPTGAAVAAALCTSKVLPKKYSIKALGVGAGKRTYERPSMVRAMLIESQEEQRDVIYKLESNIDDCSGEVLGYTMDRLLKAGARDVHYTPVYMKKNRPGYQLNVICREEDIAKLEQIIFEETTTIGIRRMEMERSVLKREMQEVETELGMVQVKVVSLGNIKKIYPEYASVAKLAKENGRSYQEVYDMVKGNE